jgi:lysophospholipase L1-like esterase
MQTFLIFGDSLVFGKGDEKYLGSWVGRIKQVIEKENKYWCVYNLGIPFGEKVEDVIKRFNIETESRNKLSTQGGKLFIILAIGINDTRLKNGIPVTRKSSFIKNINSLIRLAKNYTDSDKIIFIGLTPIDENKVEKKFQEKCFSNEVINEYNKLLLKLCEKNNVLFFLPITLKKEFSLYKKTLTEDGIHPNSQGYELIAKKIVCFLKKIIYA